MKINWRRKKGGLNKFFFPVSLLRVRLGNCLLFNFSLVYIQAFSLLKFFSLVTETDSMLYFLMRWSLCK